MKTALLLVILGWFLWVVQDWWVHRPPADRYKRTRVERRQIMVKIARVTVCVLGFICSALLIFWYVWRPVFVFSSTQEVYDYAVLFGIGYVWYLIYCWWRER